MNVWQKALIFVLGSVIGGLALAFLLVLWRPDLLARGEIRAPLAAATSQEGNEFATSPEGSNLVPPGAANSMPADAVTSYSTAVRAAAPAVVNIYTQRLVTERVPRSFFDDPFGEFAPRYRQRVQQSLGSGVIVDTEGRIVTNHHVVADAAAIQVQLSDGRVGEAEVVGRDPDTDLALLRIKLTDLPVIKLGRSDALQVGDVVLAIGNPIGLSQTVTQGIVSATGRDQLGLATFENFIQTDAPINVGNSGGALVNTRGELIGINTAIIAKNLGVEGIGFAIPVNLVRGVVKEITENGRVIRGWIGIVTDNVDDSRARAIGLERGGVLVTNLYEASPAQQSGIRRGDLIVAINGRDTTSAREVLLRIAAAAPGETLAIEVQRGAQRGKIDVKVTEAPQPARARSR
jgi:serine protease DegS